MPLYRNGGNIVFFVHIPKTGGTTVEFALSAAGAAEALRFKGKRRYSKSTLQHMHASVYREAVPREFYDWSFAIVRNPFDRFASEYKMKVIDAGGTDDIESWAETNFERFGEFPYARDNHIRPQHEFLTDHLDVFRFEDGLDAPIAAAVDRLGLGMPEIPHAQKGSPGRPRATRRAVELIADFYAADFDQLGYDPDRPDDAFDIVDGNRWWRAARRARSST